MRSGTLAGTTFIVAAAWSTASFASSPAQETGDAMVRGARIHARYCAACHGVEGRGDGPGATELSPRPRDFTAGKFRYRSTESGSPPRRSDIEHVVQVGRAGTAMPAFGGLLSESQIADVVGFILSLRNSSRSQQEPEAFSLPPFPEPSAEQLADGRALYLIVGCWKCHGTDGSGRGPSARGLKNDEGRPIRPRDFRYEPFRGGHNVDTVAFAVLSGLIGTPMPSFAEILVVPRESIDAVLESLPPEVRPEVEEFRLAAPSSAAVAVLDDAEWQRIRNRNLVALAQYVLSLSRRDHFFYQLFGENPELEARKP
jgi:mono/diheme cytochrome c family protein